jgi:uncharacterized protein
MENIIGREAEIKVLHEALASSSAELIAVYGRRRVGKTYLIRTVYEKELILELTGLNNASYSEQLENFNLTIARAFGLPLSSAKPQSWLQAFHILMQVLEPQLKNTKKVFFLDEMPWFDTPKSGFLSAFDHFWNTWAYKQKNLVVVICGSAASWMIQNIVKNKGGLHNRITRRMRLMPFNLYETELFLQSQFVHLDRYQLLQLYMTTGGIPHYLKDVRRGESVTQAIDRMCFTNDGSLSDEFKNLYAALFGSSEKHECIVKALANKPNGMTRNEILKACPLSSGGTLTRLLEELSESGFISENSPFNKTSRDIIYKLSDEYSLFYVKFIEGSKAFGEGTWQSKVVSSSWKSWSGLAFENIALKHIPQIKKALGISGVYTEQSTWRYTPKDEIEKGTQIDLLIDRQDMCINLCEIKYSLTEFTLEKKYAEELNLKRRIFLSKTGTKKTVFITMLSTFGVKENGHYLSTVQNQLTMDVLFERM